MEYYPLFLEIKNRPVLVIGGGVIAYEKIKTLLRAGASITVIAPEIQPSIRRFNRRITFVERPYLPQDLTEAYWLVFAATNDPALNAAISEQCQGLRIFCNTIDTPMARNFIVPATVRRGAITVAISTSGANPFFARLLKEQLHQILGAEYTVLGRLLKKYRTHVKARFKDIQERLAFWRTFFDQNPIDHLKNGNRKEVENLLMAKSHKKEFI